MIDSTIVKHDVDNGIVDVKLTYKNRTIEETVDLKYVIPNALVTLDKIGKKFDKDFQLKALSIWESYTKAYIDNLPQESSVNPKDDTPYREPPEMKEPDSTEI